MSRLVEALRYKPEVRGSIPHVVDGILHLLNPSGRSMAVGSTHPLTERSARNIALGVELIDLPPSYADCPEVWEPQFPGNVRTGPDLYKDCFTFNTT